MWGGWVFRVYPKRAWRLGWLLQLITQRLSLPQTRVEIGVPTTGTTGTTGVYPKRAWRLVLAGRPKSLPHTRVEIGVVTALRKHPAAGIGFIPIPCFYGIMIMSSYAKVSGDHPWDFGSKAREPLVLKAPCLLICGIIVSIHYCEGGRQMASTKGSSPLTKGPSVLLQSGAKV